MLSIWMFVAAIAVPTSPADSAKGWHADYGAALAETKQEGHPLLVVLDKPGDEQQRLDPSLLSADSGAFPLDSYALCHVDVTTAYGKEVADGFKVKDFPHVAIIDKSGSVILRRVSGDISKAEWKDVLKEHADGLRATAVTQTVAKPVVSDGAVVTAGAVVEGSVATPAATYAPVVSQPGAVSYPAAAPAQPFCPSCQWKGVPKEHADGQLATAVTQTVAKPVASDGVVVTAGAVVEGSVATPAATYAPVVSQPGAVSYPAAAPVQPFCPSCQLRNR